MTSSRKDFTFFTIGQFARLHKINKKTLMWYDEVGIFKPAVVKENGYRYYGYYQSSTLETILLLRELDVPICRIQAFLAHRSSDSLKLLLDEQITELDQKLLRLTSIRQTLVRQSTQISTIMDLDFSSVHIVNNPPETLITLHTSRNIPWEQDIRTLVEGVQKYDLPNLHDAMYGCILPVSSLYAGKLDDYCALFLVPAPPYSMTSVNSRNIHHKPGGKYLQTCYHGSMETLAEQYQELLDYAKKHHLYFWDYAYETVLNETSISSTDDYIIRIELPLR